MKRNFFLLIFPVFVALFLAVVKFPKAAPSDDLPLRLPQWDWALRGKALLFIGESGIETAPSFATNEKVRSKVHMTFCIEDAERRFVICKLIGGQSAMCKVTQNQERQKEKKRDKEVQTITWSITHTCLPACHSLLWTSVLLRKVLTQFHHPIIPIHCYTLNSLCAKKQHLHAC